MLDMMSDQYFDSRTLTSHTTGGCPVRGCTAVLERPSNGKAYPLHCPDHKIKIYSRTFGYANPLRNIRFERAYFERNIRGNPHKAETHRLGYENSEDALTWNVFSRLSRTGRLADLMSNLAQIELKAQPDLYLWGLPIRLDADESPEPFPTLVAARHQFERTSARCIRNLTSCCLSQGGALSSLKQNSCRTIRSPKTTLRILQTKSRSLSPVFYFAMGLMGDHLLP